VALGLFGLCLLAWRSSRLMIAMLMALLLSDVSVMLQARFDGGPTALGMLLRLLLVGVWLHAAAVESPSRGHAFSMGLLTGLAAFEKLSSTVLVLPLAILLAAMPGCASGRGWPGARLASSSGSRRSSRSTSAPGWPRASSSPFDMRRLRSCRPSITSRRSGAI
jgi:hypothetical protein